MRIRFPFALVFFSSLLLLGLGACSDDEPSSTEVTTPPGETTTETSASPVPALCSSVEELETSVQGVTDVDLEEDGADALTRASRV